MVDSTARTTAGEPTARQDILQQYEKLRKQHQLH
jgi:hypothetical protein